MQHLRPSSRSLVIGGVVGVGHLALVTVIWLWFVSREPYPMMFEEPAVVLSYSYPMNVWFAGTVLGLVLLGLVPTVLFLEQRLVMPTLSVAVWFMIGVYWRWQVIHESYPVADIPPLDLYIFGGAYALTTALLGGAVEYAVRRHRDWLELSATVR